MLLGKRQGGCSIGPYTWEHDGDVVEVDDFKAQEMLAIPGADFFIPGTEGAPEAPAAPAAPEAPAVPEAPAAPAAAAEDAKSATGDAPSA